MLVAVDIGNTNVSLAINIKNKWKYFWRYPTIRDESPVFYSLKIRNHLLEHDIDINKVKKIILSSVVPPLTPVFRQILPEIFPAPFIVVGPDIFPSLSLAIDNPNEIGSDLIANAVAAHTIYKKDCIVVDFGTALTFTTVTKPVGKNTIHAIQSGVLNGYVGLVIYMLASIREEVGQHFIAVATGGLSSILHPLENEFEDIDVELTMNGLKIIAEAN